MSSSLHPYRYWEDAGQYFFDTPSGARYVAYFLDLSFITNNLFTFNFDRIIDGERGIIDNQVFDTVCAILESFFVNHLHSILLVCDSSDGREEARMRLFNTWFNRAAPKGLSKIDRAGKAENYNLFISLLIWDSNPDKTKMVAILEEYCLTMLK